MTINDSFKAVFQIWFSVFACFLVSVSVLFSPYVCLDDIELGLGSSVDSFWERAAHSECSLCVLT